VFAIRAVGPIHATADAGGARAQLCNALVDRQRHERGTTIKTRQIGRGLYTNRRANVNGRCNAAMLAATTHFATEKARAGRK
jgi:hypothetical protein